MAVQITLTSEHGIDLPTAYARVMSFEGDKDEVRYSIQIHADARARNQGKAPIHSERFTFPFAVGMGPIFAACYADLKTRAMFVTGLDV